MAAPKKPYDQFADRGDGGLSVTTIKNKTVYRAKKYVGMVDTTDDVGLPVRRPKYVTGQGPTKQAAKAALARNLAAHYRLAEEERLLPRAQRTLTLATYYAETWLPAAIASDRYKTADGSDVSRRRMEMHALPALGSKALRDISPADVKTLIEVTLPTKGLGAHAVTGVRKTLHAVLADAVAEGRITRNPMEGVRWRTRADVVRMHLEGADRVLTLRRTGRRIIDLTAARYDAAIRALRAGEPVEFLGVRVDDYDEDAVAASLERRQVGVGGVAYGRMVSRIANGGHG